MCLECGCGRPGPTKIDGKSMDDHGHVHPHDHDHDHDHDHGHQHPHREIDVHQSIFAANDRQAERNRGAFSALNLLVLNAVSSPGSGKTTLLTKTIERLAPALRTGVIVGDLETDNDARRLRTTGAPVVQISTGTLCHLDATMVSKAAANLPLRELDLLVVENVGNLVCPAEFDLGEGLRIALLSVTEGEDKPLKYPPLFRRADAVHQEPVLLGGRPAQLGTGRIYGQGQSHHLGVQPHAAQVVERAAEFVQVDRVGVGSGKADGGELLLDVTHDRQLVGLVFTEEAGDGIDAGYGGQVGERRDGIHCADEMSRQRGRDRRGRVRPRDEMAVC